MSRLITDIVSISTWLSDGRQYPLYHNARTTHGFVYTDCGEGFNIIDGQKIDFKPNTITYYKEGQEYSITLTKTPLHCYVINFHMESEPFSPESFLLPDPTQKMLGRFDEIVQTWRSKKFQYDLVCVAEIYQLMADVLYMRRQDELIFPNAKRIRGAAEHIHREFSDPALRIDDLAAESGLCTRQFSALFSKLYGVAPKQYIMRLRINMARDMLSSNCDTIEHIAEMCGFSDPAYFSRAFKYSVGLSPSEYRYQLDGL